MSQALVTQALEQGKGIVRLAPTWVPRNFGIPGGRLRLHANDLYALGGHRGGISERWLSSTQQPDNGADQRHDEGLSYIAVGDERVTLRDAMALLPNEFLDQSAFDQHGGWVMFSKLFDLMYPVPHHIHQDDHYAGLVGMRGKPEAYYFPPQYNGWFGTYPYTWFGVQPDTTKDQLIDCLRTMDKRERGDNGILALSRAYRLELGTGWYVPALMLHGPGTLCTYEPQRASDVMSMWQSLVSDFLILDRSATWKHIPQAHWGDYEYMVNMLDWDLNVSRDFKATHFTPPIPARPYSETQPEGYHEDWITYGSPFFSAKQITVYPGRSVTISEPAAYGTLCIQGYGAFGAHSVSSPSLIRYGEMTEDEFFVTAKAAKAGVTITNRSPLEPLVMLKHFNPGHPGVPPLPGKAG